MLEIIGGRFLRTEPKLITPTAIKGIFNGGRHLRSRWGSSIYSFPKGRKGIMSFCTLRTILKFYGRPFYRRGGGIQLSAPVLFHTIEGRFNYSKTYIYLLGHAVIFH